MLNLGDLFGNVYPTEEIMAKLLSLITLLVNKDIITIEEVHKAMNTKTLEAIVEDMKKVRLESLNESGGNSEII